jgi:hypothetical protein
MQQTTDLERKDVRKVGWNDATCRSGPRGMFYYLCFYFFCFTNVFLQIDYHDNNGSQGVATKTTMPCTHDNSTTRKVCPNIVLRRSGSGMFTYFLFFFNIIYEHATTERMDYARKAQMIPQC